MSMPATIPRWTKELVQSLPSDGKRYELVAGELLVTPAPAAWHQTVHWRLTIALADYLRPLGLIETIQEDQHPQQLRMKHRVVVERRLVPNLGA